MIKRMDESILHLRGCDCVVFYILPIKKKINAWNQTVLEFHLFV